MIDVEGFVQVYIELRDRIKRKETAHKASIKDDKAKLDKIAGVIHGFMTEHNLKNLRTDAGTCHTSQKSTASLADPDAFMKYVIQSERFELLDRRANVTAVKAFVEENKALPPGCNLSTIETLGVTRAGAKAPDDE